MERGTGAQIALLIGCPGKGLTGVRRDVALMREELEARGFRCRELVGEPATRTGILAALEALRGEVRGGDAVVIYYSGHGGQCLVATGEERWPTWSYLVPVDHDFDRCFRGIADFEVSEHARALCEITRNVTVILDCCHAARMVRGAATRGGTRVAYEVADLEAAATRGTRSVKTLMVMPPDIAAAHEELERRRPSVDESNPWVVRVVATASAARAFEVGDRGVLTAALVEALAESRTRARASMSWDTIIRRVRERMLERGRSRGQRAELEGPRDRLPFSLRTAGDLRSRLTFFRGSDGSERVEGGRLHGVVVGGELEILSGEREIAARARVVRVYDDNAVVQLRAAVEDGSAPTPEAGSVAVRRTFGEHRTVELDPGAGQLGALRQALAGAPWLRVVEEPDVGRHRVVRAGDELRLAGLPLRPWPATSRGIEAVVRELDDLARADVLLAALADPPGLGPDAGSPWVASVMVRSTGDAPRVLGEGEVLQLGDEVYVEVRRDEDWGRAIYVNVIDRGVGGRLALVNRSEPAGVQVRPGRSVVIGRRPEGTPGLRVGWPANVDVRELPCGREEIIVVASLRPLDLRPLLQDCRVGVRRGVVRGATEPPRRPPDEYEPLPWAVARFGFTLCAPSGVS